jgi:hypothetical protein
MKAAPRITDKAHEQQPPNHAARPRTFRITRALKAGPYPFSFQRTSHCLEVLVDRNPTLVRRLERYLGEHSEAARQIALDFDSFADRNRSNSMLLWELEYVLENEITRGTAYPGQYWRRIQAEQNLSDSEHFAALYLYRAASFLRSRGRIGLLADRIARASGLLGEGHTRARSRHRRALAMKIASLID